MRSRAERRKNDYKKAIRKVKLLKDVGITGWFEHLHQASKGKAHCSCPICRCKTRDPKKKDSWCMKDRKRMDEMSYEENEV